MSGYNQEQTGLTGTGLTGTGTTGTGRTGTGLTGTGRTGTGLTGTGLTGTGLTGTGRTGTETGGLIDTSGAQVIDHKDFTKTEDHEVLVEKKAYELQHMPVEKEYVVETRYVGEQQVAGAPTELMGTEAREVEERVVAAPSGDRAVVVENVDVPVGSLQQTTTTGTTGYSGTTGTTGYSGAGTGTGTGTGF